MILLEQPTFFYQFSLERIVDEFKILNHETKLPIKTRKKKSLKVDFCLYKKMQKRVSQITLYWVMSSQVRLFIKKNVKVLKDDSIQD